MLEKKTSENDENLNLLEKLMEQEGNKFNKLLSEEKSKVESLGINSLILFLLILFYNFLYMNSFRIYRSNKK